jgi:pimeloyl-ACP methyl ester carboxylesterase
MSATGLGLLAFRPGESTLATLSWVWPVLMLALVVWMSGQIRRSTGPGRRLLTPVVAVLALASLGTTYENVAAARDAHSYPAPGRMVEVDGHRLHLDCRGQGSPTVVLFNGLGEVSASWARIAPALTPSVRVCAYDRAGQGWSDDASRPQDGVAAAKDLHAVLAAAGESGPYVLVGHSIGGPFAMTYAARYPTQVAGMVLLDSSSPEQFTRMPAYPGQYAVIRRVYALLPTVYRFGLGRATAAVAPSHLPAEAADQVRALTSSAHGARNMRDDASMLHQVFAQAQGLTTLDGRPLAVVTASGSLDDTVGWAAAQDALAALSDDHVHSVVESSHVGVLEDPAPAAEAVRAITWVVDDVRAR